jgi:ribosomal RNA-processing protein 1
LEDDSEDDEPRARKRRRVDTQDTYPSIVSNACLDDASAEARLPANILRKQMLRRLFEAASHTETRDSNRRKIYALWKAERDDEDESEEE